MNPTVRYEAQPNSSTNTVAQLKMTVSFDIAVVSLPRLVVCIMGSIPDTDSLVNIEALTSNIIKKIKIEEYEDSSSVPQP